ncbi:hypothetical protein [Pseudarthrobacter sp. PS3-L1]|uniref:hypothetical protein n=1 Tax=Pseudarthrobacter sp. PS3-L1 TaxID=3046207 RepID=UPI0024BA10B1|nr:hypothetical protein [Pseudarthrobacter sp. PS3-L1]MDJ0321817.1 hypothetical protein [Pseudarthrobacter sp. PS3-L1]
MSEGAIVAIIVAIFGVVGGGGFWTYRQSRKDAPVRQRDADIAAASTSQQMALVIAAELRLDVDRIRSDLKASDARGDKLEVRGDGLEIRIEDLEKKVRRQSRMITAWEHFYADLTGRWHIHRQAESAPNGPQATTE